MKRLIALLLATSSLLCLLAGCGDTPEETVVFEDLPEDKSIAVLEDAYVQNSTISGEDTSNKNFGTEQIMQALSASGSNGRRYSYVMFDVSELAADAKYTSIELNFTLSVRPNGEEIPENLTVRIFGCDSNWSESEITYNNVPEQFSLVCERNDIKETNVGYAFSVTDYIRKAIAAGVTKVSFYIEEATDTPAQIRFFAKESMTDKAPSLSVSYTKEDSAVYSGYVKRKELPDGLDVILANKPQMQYINVFADTYVCNSDTAGEANVDVNTNFGSAPVLKFKARMGNTSTWSHRIILLKFDISKVKLSDFNRAILILNCTAQEKNGVPAAMDVFVCDNDWDENSVTYSNCPETSSLAGISDANKGIVRVDITKALFNAISSKEKELSLTIEGDTSDPLVTTFASKEAGKDLAPTIELQTSESVGFELDLPDADVNPWSHAMDIFNTWETRWNDIKKGGTTKAETIKKIDSEYSVSVDYTTVGKTAGNSLDDKSQYSKINTRLVSTLNGYKYNVNETQKYDVYGGYTGGEQYEATGYFRTEFIDGRWWIIDPLGYPYFRTSVTTVATFGGAELRDKILKKTGGTMQTFCTTVTKRLKELGFNSAGGWSNIDALSRVTEPLSQTNVLQLLAHYTQYKGTDGVSEGSTEMLDNILPVFDPEFVTYARDDAKKQISKYASDKNVMGWMSDNELPDELNMLDTCLSLSPDNEVQMYSYAMAWTFMYKMTGKNNVSRSDLNDEYRRLFRAMVYDRYYEVVTSAIEYTDKNHMYMGNRCLGDGIAGGSFYNDEYLMKVAGYWCDIITINYYGTWTPSAELIANIQRWTNTPFVVTEWYARGMDACTPESGLTNKSGAGFNVRTQADRGKFYQNFALQLLESKYCVGFDWFQLLDNDPTNLTLDISNRDSNKGLFSVEFEEYTALTNLMKQLNTNKYSLIEFFDERG